MNGGLLNISDNVKKSKLLSVIKLYLRTLVEHKYKKYNQVRKASESLDYRSTTSLPLSSRLHSLFSLLRERFLFTYPFIQRPAVMPGNGSLSLRADKTCNLALLIEPPPNDPKKIRLGIILLEFIWVERSQKTESWTGRDASYFVLPENFRSLQWLWKIAIIAICANTFQNWLAIPHIIWKFILRCLLQ